MTTSSTGPPEGTELPMACSLAGGELADRLAAWERLAAESLQDQGDVPGGVELTYVDSAGVEATVRELARLESECCGWASWRVERAGGGVRLQVTAPGERAQAVRLMFART